MSYCGNTFKGETDLSHVALQMRASTKSVTAKIRDNFLFECLYNTYCKHTGKNMENFGVLKQRAEDAGINEYYTFEDACRSLYSWYSDRYNGIFHMRFGGKGVSRLISQKTVFDRENSIASVGAKKTLELRNLGDNAFPLSYKDASPSGYFKKGSYFYRKLYGTYDFDTLYNWKQFEKYLLSNDADVMLNSDACDFILHTAVAFLLKPKDLDEILQTYGFQRLHVKNIHHLAIYVTLGEAQTVGIENENNPFQCVRDLYNSARELLNYERDPAPHKPSDDEIQVFSSDSTRIIQKFLIENKNLHRENFLTFIGNHSTTYNMRHRRLLLEHKKLVDLFAVLYDNQTNFNQEQSPDEEQNALWEVQESQYCLYMFICRFCEPFKHKELNRRLYGEIKKGLSHPTREIMIILWMYAYCFLFRPNIATNGSLENKIPFSRIDGTDVSQYPFQAFIEKTQSRIVERIYGDEPNRFSLSQTFYALEVLAYLTDENGPLSGFGNGDIVVREFSGDELIAFLNEKLRDYAWGADALSEKRKFDANILSLKGLRIRFDDSFDNVKDIWFRGAKVLFDKDILVDNVPAPLVLITDLFGRAKSTANDYPLKCKLYEQL